MGAVDHLDLPDAPQKPRQKFETDSRVDIAIEREKQEDADLRAANKAIDARDHRICRCCGRRSDPEATGLLVRGHRAHIVYASAGGSNDPSNRVTLCAKCHNDEHKNRLRFTADGGPYVGIDANKGMEFWRKSPERQWYLSKRETSPCVTDKD